jgi:hypothetical protein
MEPLFNVLITAVFTWLLVHAALMAWAVLPALSRPKQVFFFNDMEGPLDIGTKGLQGLGQGFGQGCVHRRTHMGGRAERLRLACVGWVLYERSAC